MYGVDYVQFHNSWNLFDLLDLIRSKVSHITVVQYSSYFEKFK